MVKKSKGDLEATKALMGAMLKLPPKQHDAMKIGKKKPKVRGAKKGPATKPG